jgi:hypothetical protein
MIKNLNKIKLSTTILPSPTQNKASKKGGASLFGVKKVFKGKKLDLKNKANKSLVQYMIVNEITLIKRNTKRKEFNTLFLVNKTASLEKNPLKKVTPLKLRTLVTINKK